MTHPGRLAVFDQARSEFSAQVDILVKVYEGLTQTRGSGQACADLTAMFALDDFPEVVVRATLAEAVRVVAELRAGAA